MSAWRIDIGDCRALLRALGLDSMDACVTDPPYELGFMGKKWDASGIAFDPAVWSEVYRVLKPGAHLLAFGGTRTYHRMVCAIEDAGFEIRDSIHWMYGSGFPKSHNLDGAHEGWGTALKPAHEPIVVARKPLVGTVAANVQAHGTGALNIDGCRVAAVGRPLIESKSEPSVTAFGDGLNGSRHAGTTDLGRWPPNVLLTHSADCVRVGERKVKSSNVASGPTLVGGSGEDFNRRGKNRPNPPPNYSSPDGTETIPAYQCAPDCPVALLDRQSAAMGMHSAGAARKRVVDSDYAASSFNMSGTRQMDRVGDSGGASRFFPTFEWDPFLYCAKPPTVEREIGLAHRKRRKVNDGREKAIDNAYQRAENMRANTHPTVKPIDLMRWLVRLVTPKGGIVLDPFAGSGTTIVAALRENLRAHGCELDPEHVSIARDRIVGDSPLFNVDTRKAAGT